MKVLVSGATGLVGTGLVAGLRAEGHAVAALTRAPVDGEHVLWDPAKGVAEPAKLEGFDAVVHLAGDNIAKGRWNAVKKARIRDSRVAGTARLVEALAKLNKPPGVVVGASAIGFYGHRGDDAMTETSSPGSSFLAEVCRDWEAAYQPVAKTSRLVLLRIGVVLSRRGGALAAMLTPFLFGAGGVIGSGKQFMSWITREDLVGVIRHAISRQTLAGPVNAVAPHPVSNADFTKALGRAIHRPTIFPMPAFAARLAFGEMADELLLSSTRVEPKRLVESGFAFKHPEIDGALKAALADR